MNLEMSAVGAMAKVNRFGQASVLTPAQIQDLWNELEQPHLLISKIAYYTAARVGEVLQLRAEDIKGGFIVFRASNTKTKTTRTVEIPQQLQRALDETHLPTSGYLFPGSGKSGHLTPLAFEKALKKATGLIGLEGVSTHSFRRSMATHLHEKGVPLRAIAQITGHSSLAALERYLDISRKEAAQKHHSVLDELFPVDCA